MIDDGIQIAGEALEPQLQDTLCAIPDPRLRTRRSSFFAHGQRVDDLPQL